MPRAVTSPIVCHLRFDPAIATLLPQVLDARYDMSGPWDVISEDTLAFSGRNYLGRSVKISREGSTQMLVRKHAPVHAKMIVL
jgi:hypothetical protein